ncbi:leucyl/phenylalanyl-tRNA--protein transferase [Nocardioides sp. LS1]|uniref:leucyl/phenylalanyl-tRNA--protein transferase n=1 Tax=Nocardioides sp. LS1 TaxID=1027620 RepID=UPI000F617541
MPRSYGRDHYRGGVPVEPPPSAWSFGDPTSFDDLDDLVAIGADLAPGTLLAAYRRGLFPMPSGTPGDPMYWFSPVHRGVLPLDGLVVSRSLRRACRDHEIRVDTAFAEVLDACADPHRDSGWIDEDIRAAYTRLHDLGWAHSVEAWRDGRLVGGLYGVAIGGLFAGESMFHRERDASKVALVGLVERLRDRYADDRVLDVQWCTPHLATLGVIEVPRAAYLRRLPVALAVPAAEAFA